MNGELIAHNTTIGDLSIKHDYDSGYLSISSTGGPMQGAFIV